MRAWDFAHRCGTMTLINAEGCVFKLGWLFYCRFGFWQINLNFGLVFLKRRRDDEKDQKDDENIDERNDDYDGRPSFSYCKLHRVKCAARFTLPASKSAASWRQILLPARIHAKIARNSIC